MRTRLLLVVLASLTAMLMLPSAPASAAPQAGARCYKPGKTVFTVSGLTTHAKVGYAKPYYLSPGETVTTVRRVKRDMTLRSKVKAKYGGELGLSGLSKLLARAEVKGETKLEVFTYVNTVTKVSVKRKVHNGTRRNKKYVAFKASLGYSGKYRRYICLRQSHMSKHPEWIHNGSGTWRTIAPLEDGNLRCGAGAPGRVAKYVLSRWCG